MTTTARKAKPKAKPKAKRVTVSASHRPQPAASRTITLAPEQDGTIFLATEAPAVQVKVERGHVRLFVNGSDKGDQVASGKRLGEFVKEAASYYGIKAFSVYADGHKVSPKMASTSLGSYAKVEVVTKDARGAAPAPSALPDELMSKIRAFLQSLTSHQQQDQFLDLVKEISLSAMDAVAARVNETITNIGSKQ